MSRRNELADIANVLERRPLPLDECTLAWAIDLEADLEAARPMSLLEEVAREFLTINRDILGADGPRAGELAIHSLALRHDLNLLRGVPCDCDEGTCPGLITRSGATT